MGEVHLAHDAKLKREIALKIMLPSGSEHGTERLHTRMVREAKALAKLDHPHVCKVFDVGRQHGRTFLAIEYIEGETLDDWLDRRPNRRRVIDVLVRAGRGLAHAHATNLVHRDFKPQNVMVGPTGHPYVMDFGLVREQRRPRSAPTNAEITGVDDDHNLTPGPLGAEHSRTGNFLGTPAYMAPEQLRREHIGPAADQFAWCATVYEALCGRRPFVDGPPSERLAAIAKGPQWPARFGFIPERAPWLRSIPGWLRSILTRGMNFDPTRRHASMTDLLRELDQRQQSFRRRRRFFASAALLGAATFGGGQLVSSVDTPDPCPRTRRTWQGSWDSAAKAEIRNAFRQSGAPHWRQSLERVSSKIDSYVDQWLEQRHDACQQSRTSPKTVGRDALDLRMNCLRLGRSELVALVREFRDADTNVVIRATGAVHELPDLERCADVETLRSERPWPSSARRRGQVESLRARLAELTATMHAGRWTRAASVADSLLGEAHRLDFEPVVAEVHVALAHYHRYRKDVDAAIHHSRAALATAVSSGHRSVAADASLALLYDWGYRGDNTAFMEHALPLASARIRSAGSSLDLQSKLANLHAILLVQTQQYEAAVERFFEATRIAKLAHGDEHPRVALIMGNSALSLAEIGRRDEALPWFERALRSKGRTHGDAHPSLHLTRENMAKTLREVGRWQEAVDLGHASAAYCGEPSSDRVCFAAVAAGALGSVELGDYTRALEDLLAAERAEREARATLGDLPIETELARVFRLRGDFEAALWWANKGIAATGRRTGLTVRALSIAQAERAYIHFARGEHELAQTWIRRARPTHFENATTPKQLEVLQIAGDIDLARGNMEGALHMHELSARGAELMFGTDNPNWANHSLGWARALRHAKLFEPAHQQLDAAFAVMRDTVGPRSVILIPYHLEQGELALALHQNSVALEHFVSAERLADPQQALTSTGARARFGRARAHWAEAEDDPDRREYALHLAHEALSEFRSHGAQRRAAVVEAWMASSRR